jgi:hypothetical protein
MCKVFPFQRSLEAKGGPILSLIFGDGGADFGWICSRNKAKTPDHEIVKLLVTESRRGGVKWG